MPQFEGIGFSGYHSRHIQSEHKVNSTCIFIMIILEMIKVELVLKS